MMMKKKLSALLVLAAVTCMGIVPAFAISMQDAEQIVKNEYPGAVIHRVERDYDDGRRVYEVDFFTATPFWEAISPLTPTRAEFWNGISIMTATATATAAIATTVTAVIGNRCRQG